MNQLYILLGNGFYRYHAFVRPSDRIIDSGRIVKIVLIANNKAFDIARIEQNNFMTELGQFSSPMVGASTRLYANNTDRIVGKIHQ